MKKTKVIVLCIIGVIFTFIYAHVDVMHVIYDKNVDNSNYIGTGLLGERTIKQEFVVLEDTLDGVKFKCTVGGEYTNASLVYSLTDLETGKIVAQGTKELRKAKNSKFLKVPFRETINSKNKRYLLTLELDSEKPEDGIGLYYQPETEENTKLSIQDEEIDGTLILKEYAHHFDLETFVVVLFFMAFITVFMMILYRFFR